jgi:hexulose-6-phosphate isomerase
MALQSIHFFAQAFAMHRRSALQSLAAFGVAGSTFFPTNPMRASAAEETATDATPWIRKTLKIGMIGVKGSLEDKFRAAKDAGFEGVEMNVPGVDVEAVKSAAKATGLIVDGSVCKTHWGVRHTDPDPNVRKQALADLKASLEETAAFGGESVLLVAGHGKDGTADEVYKRSTDNIFAALETAKKVNVPILIENVWNHFLYDHNGGSDQSAEPLAKFVDQFDTPLVGVQFDLGNHWKYGDIAQWVRTLDKRIQKLDIKGFSRAENKFTKITEGDVDWPAIEQALRDIQFRGWCAAEVGGGGPQRLREIVKHMDAALRCNVNA